LFSSIKMHSLLAFMQATSVAFIELKEGIKVERNSSARQAT